MCVLSSCFLAFLCALCTEHVACVWLDTGIVIIIFLPCPSFKIVWLDTFAHSLIYCPPQVHFMSCMNYTTLTCTLWVLICSHLLSLSYIPTENVSSCERVRFSFLFPSYVNPMSRPLSKIINVGHTEKRFICLFCVYSSVSSRLLLPRASFSFFGWERKIYNFSTFCFLSSYNFIIAMCFALLWLNNITWIFSAIASVFLSPVLVATISCTLFTSANIFSLGLDRRFPL